MSREEYRISQSHARQENLYATYSHRRQYLLERSRKGVPAGVLSEAEQTGKCIEARELIIALPEIYTTFEPQQVLEEFHRANSDSGTMWNVYRLSTTTRRKTNYHIHLIFSERRLLAEPDIKIATRSVFYDETGKRVRTKKEITDENGQVREGCTVINKGGSLRKPPIHSKGRAFQNRSVHSMKPKRFTPILSIATFQIPNSD